LLSAFTNAGFSMMHAGFVNGSGILLALFTVLFASNTLIILFIMGLAVIAQFTKLLQVNVKQKISLFHHCPNGFHDYAVWFGFFNAAVVHLLLHGFYKAYLFLSAGEIGHSKPQNQHPLKSNRCKR
jgi:NAD(P)H-quinone oxidoreductase subunit 5